MKVKIKDLEVVDESPRFCPNSKVYTCLVDHPSSRQRFKFMVDFNAFCCYKTHRCVSARIIDVSEQGCDARFYLGSEYQEDGETLEDLLCKTIMAYYVRASRYETYFHHAKLEYHMRFLNKTSLVLMYIMICLMVLYTLSFLRMLL